MLWPRAFYRRDARKVARELLGSLLVRELDGERLSGVIVETEAYLGERDAACHSFHGRRTQRNASMYGDGGTTYVYFVYGLHHCVNVVTDRVDEPTAVLIRALSVREGEATMRERRGPKRPLLAGPAMICQAMAIDRELDGHDLTQGQSLWIEPGERHGPIHASPRVGVGYASRHPGGWVQRPLRFRLGAAD